MIFLMSMIGKKIYVEYFSAVLTIVDDVFSGFDLASTSFYQIFLLNKHAKALLHTADQHCQFDWKTEINENT